MNPVALRLQKRMQARQQDRLDRALERLQVCRDTDTYDADYDHANTLLDEVTQAAYFYRRDALGARGLDDLARTRLLQGKRVDEAYLAASEAGLSLQAFVTEQLDQGHLGDLRVWFQYRSALSQTPQNWAILAALQFLSGSAAEAQATLARALRLGGTQADVWGEAGTILYRGGDFETAASWLSMAIQSDPGRIALRERLAVCLLNTRGIQPAHEALCAAQAHGALTDMGWTILGRLALEVHDMSVATSAFTRALRLNPQNLPALLFAATVSGGVGDYSALRRHVDAALLVPRKTTIDLLMLANVLSPALGSGSPDADDAQRLRTLWAQVSVQAPDNTVILRQLAHIFEGIGEREDALGMCRRLVKLPMPDAESVCEVAALCLGCEAPELALGALRAGHRAFKDHAGLARRLAHAILLHANRPQAAQVLPLLRQAMADGTQPEADRASIVAVASILLPDKQATHTLWSMCTFDDQAPEAYIAAATAYIRLGICSVRAEKALRYVLEKVPQHAAARALLGRLLKLLGRLHEAAPYLDPPMEPTDLTAVSPLLARVCGPAGAQVSEPCVPAPEARYRGVILGETLEGILAGYSADGSMVLQTDDHKTAWCATLQPVSAARASLPVALASVAPHLQRRAAPALVTLFDTALQKAVQGSHSTAAYMQALAACGGESFVVGGLVRGLLHACAHALPVPDDDHDVDIATTLAPAAMFWVTREVAHGILGRNGRPGGVTSPASAAWHGVASYNRLDIASLRVQGMFADKTQVLGRAAPVFPLVFAPDIAADATGRDFRCNAVYYDPCSQRLLDPTDGGIEDAIHRRLRLVSTAYVGRNPSLALRFCKLRHAGYSTDAQTSAHIRDNAKKFMHDPELPRRVARLLARKAASQADMRGFIEETLSAWGAILEADCGLAAEGRALVRHAPQVTEACQKLARA